MAELQGGFMFTCSYWIGRFTLK